MKKCSIISYIDSEAEKLMKQVDRDSYIICADIGMSYALDAGISPNLLIGDLDSYKGVVPPHLKVLKLPEEKDDTDTNYCVNYAVKHGFTDITVYGGIGGRFDHSVANMQTLAGTAPKVERIALISANNKVYALHNGKLVLPSERGSYFSVFSASDVSEGVTIEGAKYCVKDFTLKNTFPIGTSNEFKNSEAIVSVEKGTLLIAISKK